MIFDRIEWDEYNLDHATRRLSVEEIEQVIWNARVMSRSKQHRDRAMIQDRTDGGRRAVVIVQLVRDGVRPITGWEE